MSDPLTERLGRFTPEGAGLDRDAILFAAGRASVRSPRTWKVVAGVLTVTQSLTLMLLLPWPATPPAPPKPPVQRVVPVRSAPAPRPLTPRSLEEETRPAPALPGDSYVPDSPPLSPSSIHGLSLN